MPGQLSVPGHESSTVSMPRVEICLNRDGTACMAIDGISTMLCDGCGDVIPWSPLDSVACRDSCVCDHCGFWTVLHAPRRAVGFATDCAGLTAELSAVRSLVLEAVGARNAASIIDDANWFYGTPLRRKGLQTLLQMIGLCDEQMLSAVTSPDVASHTCADNDFIAAINEGERLLNRVIALTSSHHSNKSNQELDTTCDTPKCRDAGTQRRISICTGSIQCVQIPGDCKCCSTVQELAKRSENVVRQILHIFREVSGPEVVDTTQSRIELSRLGTSLLNLRTEFRARTHAQRFPMSQPSVMGNA